MKLVAQTVTYPGACRVADVKIEEARGRPSVHISGFVSFDVRIQDITPTSSRRKIFTSSPAACGRQAAVTTRSSTSIPTGA